MKARFRLTASLLCPFLSLGLAFPAFAQSAAPAMDKMDFQQFSDGKNMPPTLLLKNLTKEWRRTIIETQSDNSNPYGGFGGMRNPMFRDALADMGIGVYFTRGQSVQLGKETYLVAYRIQNNYTQREMQEAMNGLYGHGNNVVQRGPRKFSPDTKLTLALLNLSSMGSLSEVRPFSPQNDIMGPADIIEASNRNLQQLGTHLINLNSRYDAYGLDGRQIRDENTLKQMLQSYFHTPQTVFIHPQTKEPYRFNRALFGKSLARVRNARRLVAFYEAKPGSDGKRGAVFFDGHTQRVPSANWARIIGVAPQGLTESQLRILSARNLQKLGQHLKRYVQRRDGNLPPMTDAASTRNAVIRYAGYQSRTAFVEPKTNQIYRPNPALSGKKLAQIANAAQLIAFYEPKAGADGKLGAVYLDGHVARVPLSAWKRAKAVKVKMKKTTSTRVTMRPSSSSGEEETGY